MGALQKRKPDLLPSFLQQWPQALAEYDLFEVGFSGGMDSTVLLDLLARAREHRVFSLSAVHVHHGLSPHADHWAQICQHRCEKLDIILQVVAVQVTPVTAAGVEADARKARYHVYAATSSEVIALAQHQDDQAETILLQLLRGGGVRALAAMPVLRRWQQKWVWRPLLAWPRATLTAYAKWRGLGWVEDESNADICRRRNLLRHVVLPPLAAGIPHYRIHLIRSASLMADAATILAEVAKKDLAECSLSTAQLALPYFLRLTPARQRQLLVFWIEQYGYTPPTPAAIEIFCHQVVTAATDRNPTIWLNNAVVCRYRQQLVLCQIPNLPPTAVTLSWPWKEGVPSGWAGTLRFAPHPRGIDVQLLVSGFTLVPRVGGERLLVKIGHKPVKTLLQEHGVPPVLRGGWPMLLLANGRLAAVPGIAIADDCRAPTGEGWWPNWVPASVSR